MVNNNKYFYKCPICGSKLKENYSYFDYDIHMIVEYMYSCPKCLYSEGYSYGNHRYGVEGVSELIHSYNYHLTKREFKQYKKKLWKYRKLLLRTNVIKGRNNNL